MRTQLYAFERSPFRYKTLEKMLALSNCLNVVAQRADFLDTDPLSPQFAKVTRMYVAVKRIKRSRTDMLHSLLDPSCSGSGIVNRLDYLLEDGAYAVVLHVAELIVRRYRFGRRNGCQSGAFGETRHFPAADGPARVQVYLIPSLYLDHLIWILTSPCREADCVLHLLYPSRRGRTSGAASPRYDQ